MESRVAHDERTRSIDDKERMNMNLPAIIGKSSGTEIELADQAATEANTEAFRVLVDRARREPGPIPRPLRRRFFRAKSRGFSAISTFVASLEARW